MAIKKEQFKNKEIEIKPQEEDVKVKTYIQSKDERKIWEFVSRRIEEMKEYRKNLKIESEWDEADKEYIPSEISPTNVRTILETDQLTGLRSHPILVNDASQNWRSDNSEPTLLVKIQQAIAIMVDRNPEASLTALLKKYEKRTQLANAAWKRSWLITQGREYIKLFLFNLVKYGWAVGRVYPRVIKYDKRVLTSYDTENPDNNKYEDKNIVWFNDIWRENLDPRKSWISETSEPYKTSDEGYFELDFSYDAAKIEFGKYSNFKHVKRDSKKIDEKGSKPGDKNENLKKRKDIVTVGFYQNRLKDLFSIIIPKDKIVLHYCPLPNDLGVLDFYHTLWILRDAKSPYGISLWKIIRQDKSMYDKLMNMTMDQLVLSIYKMFFYTSAAAISQGDNRIKLEPGVGMQLANGEIKWSDIPGPGREAWQGIEVLKSLIDSNSGIQEMYNIQKNRRPTLGQALMEKENTLNRAKVPMSNVAYAIEQDIFTFLAWAPQVYSLPDVKHFASIKDMLDYEEETGTKHQDIFLGQGGGFEQKSSKKDNSSEPRLNQTEGINATFMPQLALHLEDRRGQLYESKESRFFQVGKDFPVSWLEWKGLIKVHRHSMVVESSELEKQRKSQLFNFMVPLLQFPPELVAKPVKQLIMINDEDPEDWMPDNWLTYLKEDKKKNLFIPQQQQQVQPIQQSSNSIQANVGTSQNQGGQTVVPQGNSLVSNIKGAVSAANGSAFDKPI